MNLLKKLLENLLFDIFMSDSNHSIDTLFCLDGLDQYIRREVDFYTVFQDFQEIIVVDLTTVLSLDFE